MSDSSPHHLKPVHARQSNHLPPIYPPTHLPIYPSLCAAPALLTPNMGTALSLIPCTLSFTRPPPLFPLPFPLPFPFPPSAPLGLPVAGVLLGQAHSVSKSICSSSPLSSLCRLGTRVASNAERSSIVDSDGVFVAMGTEFADRSSPGSWMGERCTEKSC